MKKLLLICLAICLCLGMYACGGGNGEATTNPPDSGDNDAKTPTTDDGDTTAPEQPAASGDSIFRVTQTIMPKWDPAVGSDYASGVVLVNTYDPLVFPTPDGSVEPWVAESWEISEDGLTWDFKIREDITFHSGNKLTANDVKYSMDRLCTIGEGYAYLFYQYIDSVEVTDEYNVRFNCSQPYGPLLNSLVRFYIVDQKLLESNYDATGDYGENGDYGKSFLQVQDAGSGPYVVDAVSTNLSVGGAKFADYWAGIDADCPERFLIYASNDAVTVKTMMARQELEAADHYQAAENIQSMMSADSSLKLAYNYSGGGINLWLNNQREPLNDPLVREAFGYLVDYATVCTIIQPDSVQKKSVIPSNLLGHVEVYDYSFDLEKAKELIAQSGHASDIGSYEIEFVWNSESPDREKIALMIQSTAQQVGINIKIVELPWSTIVANSADVSTSPMMTLASISPVTADSGAQFSSMLRSKEVGTWEGMNWPMSDELDAMIDDALLITDNAQRAKAYEEIQKWCGENNTFVPITETPERIVYQASYVDMNPTIGLQGYAYYLREIHVYPDKRN